MKILTVIGNGFDLLDKKNKNTLSLRKKIIKEIEQEKYDEIYILGHSLGRADKEFFQALNPNAKFFYYYFGDLHSESNVVTSKAIDVFNWNCEWISSENLYI